MSIPPPRARRAGVAAAALLALTSLVACSSDGDKDKAPAEAPSTQAIAPEPEPGPATAACYPLPYDAAVAPTSTVEAVDCAQPHTSVTFATGAIDAVVDGHLLAVDSNRVQAQVSSACPNQLLAYVGGSLAQLRLSMIRSIWFTPTVEQSDAGATWYRCDAVLLDGASKLADLDGDLKGVLGGATVPDRYAMCGTAAPDAPEFERVPLLGEARMASHRRHRLRGRRLPGRQAGPGRRADPVRGRRGRPRRGPAHLQVGL